VAQIVACRLAVRQTRVRILARQSAPPEEGRRPSIKRKLLRKSGTRQGRPGISNKLIFIGRLDCKAVSHWPGDVEDNKPHGSGKVVFHPDDLGGRKYFEGS
jgi:hypothetical protein